MWSCRSVQTDSCFQGYWIDLTAAGVQPDTDYNLTLTFPQLAPAPGPRIGWDMPNGDFPGMPVTLNASDFNLCWGMCNVTAGCVAWAYCDPSPSSCNIPAPLCYLKQTVEPWVQNACRVAGVQAPGGGGSSAFQGVYYDNVDTIDAPVWPGTAA